MQRAAAVGGVESPEGIYLNFKPGASAPQKLARLCYPEDGAADVTDRYGSFEQARMQARLHLRVVPATLVSLGVVLAFAVASVAFPGAAEPPPSSR